MECRVAIQTFVVAGLLSSHQVEAPRLCDKDTEYPHGDRCCRLCPAGTHFVKSCEQNHGISTCEKCPPNTFAEVDNHLRECYRCSNPCNEQWGEVQFSNCTNYHDRECRCKKGMHRDGEVCKRHTPCPPGQGVIRKGSHRSDTRCQPCPPGTFSKRSSIFEKCKPWTNCAEEGLKTREEGNASRDAKCGGRLQPQQATPTSVPSHNTSATPAMDTPTSSVTVPQSSGYEQASTSAATVTPASTTLGSVAVTSSTPTTSQSASPTSSQSTSKQPGSGKSMTTENSLNEERDPGPNNQPTIAVNDLVTIIICVLILLMLIIGFIVLWCNNKKNEEQENTANANGPPIGANPADHQQQSDVPDQGSDLNPQDLQERQALLPRMEQGEGELEPDAMEQARGGQPNQQRVQIVVPTGTGAHGGQINNQGLYQDQRTVAYDVRQQTVNLQFPNATVAVHQHFAIESPEYVQIGQNTINQSPSTANATNPEITNSEDSEHGE